MSSGSAPTPRCGRRERRPFRRCPGPAADGGPSCCGAMASTTRSASRRSPTRCRPRPGTISPGAWEARIGWPRAWPAFGHARSMATPGEAEPTKYWLSTMPENIPFDRLVDLAKLRWRIERDYQELKQELGFGDYEGRGWRGFHHHATLCIAAYGFLIAERGALPPSGPSGAPLLSGSTLPCDYRPRGAADPARTARAELDCHHAPPSHRRPRPDATEMPLLQRADPQNPQNSRLLTQ